MDSVADQQFTTKDINLAAAAIAFGGQLTDTISPPPGGKRLAFVISGVSRTFDLLVAQGRIMVNARDMCAAANMLISLVQASMRSRA